LRRTLPAGARIRVLVVDDSVVIRRLVTHALEEDKSIEVVGSAANGVLALQRIPQLAPDLVTLDIEMPEMDGIETLRQIRRLYPRTVVIMFSTLTRRGAAATLDALAAGANDYVPKAANCGSLDVSLAALREELIPRIHQFFTLAEAPPGRPAAASAPAPSLPPVAGGMRKAVVIGVSTGGPNALAVVLPMLPRTLPVPVLIVQHMPPMFTGMLATRLDTLTGLHVTEAVEGEAVEPGHVYIAPGGRHMEVRRDGSRVVTHLSDGPPENSCRPAADVLFRSAAEVWGGATVAAVLTGMGQDGLRGVENLRALGSPVIVQDEASSVVWGMPGAVAKAGLAGKIVPLAEVAAAILREAQ
jgi:two-component system chemotaxis response regulator CheB